MISLPTWAFVLICIAGGLLVIALIIAIIIASAMSKLAAGVFGGLIKGMGGPDLFPDKKDRRR